VDTDFPNNIYSHTFHSNICKFIIMSDVNKEIEAFYKQIEDPENYTNERWWHLFTSWWGIALEIKWDDSFYDGMVIKRKESVEREIKDFIMLRASEDESSLANMMKTWTPLTKENHKEIFPDSKPEDSTSHQHLSKEDYNSFFKNMESDNYTPNKWTKTEKLVAKSKSMRKFRKDYIEKHGFDKNISTIYDILKKEHQISNDEVYKILNPPSNYFFEALINKVNYSYNNPKSDRYRDGIILEEAKNNKNEKIFLVREK